MTFPKWVQKVELRQKLNPTLEQQEGPPRTVSGVPRSDQEQETLESVRYDAYRAWCDLMDYRIRNLPPNGRMGDCTKQPFCENYATGTCTHKESCKFYHHFPPTHEYVNFTQDVEDIPTGKIPYRNKAWALENANTTCGETSSATTDSDDTTSAEELEANISDG